MPQLGTRHLRHAVAALNADIGGMNFAGVEVLQRTEASLTGLRAAYSDDVVDSASLRLPATPVID